MRVRFRDPTVLLLVAVFTALVSCSSNDEPDTSDKYIQRILNGPTSQALTTYWTSQGSNCVAGEGQWCFGPLDLALAQDGTAEWRAQDKDQVVSAGRIECCTQNGWVTGGRAKLAGRTTWTKLGPTVIVVNDMKFGDGSLTLNAINGSVEGGLFVSATRGLNVRWEIHTGRISTCPSASETDGGTCKCCVCCQ